jgi:deoxyribodipyrimidine photo-lyase
MPHLFPTDHASILKKIDEIDPLKYAKSRNFINGHVTYLSPYISRGVISTKQVLEHVLSKGYKVYQMESFVKELCWRDYFQRVGQEKNLNEDIKNLQEPVSNHEIPTAVVNASTGIEGIDNAIQGLYDTGYMHNHCRMYTAAVVCNVAKSHWLHPAKWMYYHLLDGDWASNACSWQWVAGSNSSKKYITNQDNINKYTHTNQSNTFLDASYEAIAEMDTPNQLLATEPASLETILPIAETLQLNKDLPTFIYNYYNLDSLWHEHDAGNRVLLLEPDFFKRYPVSQLCIDFILLLAKNIPNMQLFVGSFQQLCNETQLSDCYFKEHPLNDGYVGNQEPRDWIIDNVSGYFPSFFSYWKKMEREIFKKYGK